MSKTISPTRHGTVIAFRLDDSRSQALAARAEHLGVKACELARYYVTEALLASTELNPLAAPRPHRTARSRSRRTCRHGAIGPA